MSQSKVIWKEAVCKVVIRGPDLKSEGCGALIISWSCFTGYSFSTRFPSF